MLLLAAQRLEQEAVAAVALLAAFVRAAAAGRAVPGGAARLVGPPARHGVTGHAASAQHADGAVSGRGGRLTLDVEVLVSGGEVQVGVLAEVPVAVEERLALASGSRTRTLRQTRLTASPHVSERRVQRVLELLLPAHHRSQTRTSKPGQGAQVAAEGELCRENKDRAVGQTPPAGGSTEAGTDPITCAVRGGER